MRSSLVGLELLLACVLVWGTSVVEEKKECCGPGVPPEKSCCPKGNSTSQGPEKQEEQPGVPTEPNSEKPKRQRKQQEELTSEELEEELEERGKEYREVMQKEGRHEFMFLKQKALLHISKHKKDAFYRSIEDTDVKVKNAIGTIVTFTQFLVKTNCTKEEGRKFSSPWVRLPSAESVLCMALPKNEPKALKCRVTMFLEAGSSQSTVLWQKCKPVVFFYSSEDGSEDNMDLHDMLDYLAGGFEPSF